MDTRIDTARDEGTNHAVEAGPLSGRFGSVSRRRDVPWVHRKVPSSSA